MSLEAGIPLVTRSESAINHTNGYGIQNPYGHSDAYGLDVLSYIAKVFNLGDEAVFQAMTADGVIGSATIVCDIKEQCEFAKTNNQIIDALVEGSEISGDISTITLAAAAGSNPIGAAAAGTTLCVAVAEAGGAIIGSGINIQYWKRMVSHWGELHTSLYMNKEEIRNLIVAIVIVPTLIFIIYGATAYQGNHLFTALLIIAFIVLPLMLFITSYSKKKKNRKDGNPRE